MTESISPSETIVCVTFEENDEIVYSFVLLPFCVGCKMLSKADATYKSMFGFCFINEDQLQNVKYFGQQFYIILHKNF